MTAARDDNIERHRRFVRGIDADLVDALE